MATMTFAVVGHNEAPTLLRALTQAAGAAGPNDHVRYVDSASTDDSAAIAAGAGIECVAAPLGKGRAMAKMVAVCETEYICFVDADIFGSADNIPARLAACVRAQTPTMVVGEFPIRDSIMSNTWAIYDPIVAALFPEVEGLYGAAPLSGFRAVRTASVVGELPDGFGVEAHLNVAIALAGEPVAVCDVGEYEGRFLHKPTMGLEISAALFDLAVAHGRLTLEQRAVWEAWVRPVVEYIATYHGKASERVDFLDGLHRLAGRSTPATRSSAVMAPPS